MALYTDTTGTIKETRVLAEHADEALTSLELQEIIETTNYVLWYEADSKKSMINKDLVEELKITYSNLGLKELHLLFWDNYYSFIGMPIRDQENSCSIRVRNKVLALGTLIKSYQ